MLRFDEYAFLFDTNIFNRMISAGNEHYYEKIYRHLETYFHRGSGNAVVFNSPSLVLETLGISPSYLSEKNILKRNLGTTPDEVIRNVFKEASEFYEGLPELSLENLKSRYEQMWTSASPAGKNLLRDLILNKIDAQHRPYVVQNLALDYYYGFRFQKVLPKKETFKSIHLSHLADVARIMSREMNVSPARGVYEIADELRKRNRTAIEVIKEIFSVKKGLKLNSDKGDMDIVHFAVMGIHLDYCRKAFVLTGDPLDSVRLRVKTYKLLVEHLIKSIEGTEIEKFKMNEGSILVLDQESGNIIEEIKVSSLALV